MKHIFCICIANMISISSYSQVETAEMNHYLFPEFTQGIVLLKTGKKETRLLNYNSLTEEMIFDNKGNKLTISKTDIERIDSVFIGDRKFVVLNNKFFELIHDSKWDLYVEHKSDLKERSKDAGLGGTSQTSAISTYSAAHLGGGIYNLTLPDNFEVESYFLYWLEKNGKLKQFANMNQLKKSYKDKKNLFNDYAKKYNIKYEDSESIIELLKVLESN